MQVFLCSHFAAIGSLLKEKVAGKNLVFVPTAARREIYKGYVGEARKCWKKLGVHILEVDISKTPNEDIQKAFQEADILYFTGGNTFFLMDQLRQTGTDTLIKNHIQQDKLYIGESAGAIVCAKDISYIRQMDTVPRDFSQADFAGLGLVDVYPLPHYGCFPFKKVSRQIRDDYSSLNLCPLTNSEALWIQEEAVQKVSVE